MTSWNPMAKRPHLSQRPLLSQGLASHLEDRDLQVSFQALQEAEDRCKRLYKEVRRYEECAAGLQRLEHAMASDLCNSQVCRQESALRRVAEDYQSAVYQMGHASDDLVQLSQKTVVEPMKKLASEFGAVAAALKKRDAVLQECLKSQAKFEKQNKLEKTGTNVVKTEQARKSLEAARADFEQQNRLLLLELPQFHERRVDYFQPCLQALIRSQVDYYGETTRLFTHLVSANPDAASLLSDEEHREEVDGLLGEIKALSIVGS